MRGDDVNRNPRRTLTAVLALVAALRAHAWVPEGRGDPGQAPAPAAAPVEPAGPPSPEVQAAVQGVLDTGRHPWLSWPEVTGRGSPRLKILYAAEPDGLFWFAGESPHPALAGALDTLARCGHPGTRPRGLRRVAPAPGGGRR